MRRKFPLATLTLAFLFLILFGTGAANAQNGDGCCECSDCASNLVECMDVTGGQPQCDAFCASRNCTLPGFTLGVECADVTPCEEIVGEAAIMAPTMSWPLIVGLSIFLVGLGITYARKRSTTRTSSDTP